MPLDDLGDPVAGLRQMKKDIERLQLAPRLQVISRTEYDAALSAGTLNDTTLYGIYEG